MNPEEGHRDGLGLQGLGVFDERWCALGPGRPVGGGDLGDGAGRVADRRPDLDAQPAGGVGRARICSIVSMTDMLVQ